ncbi:DUF1624 domain-containing protein [Rhodobacteraceae bacterium CCMM004]|nr:DUF1624 domain-containing protein [Rhodobacteraceae bacterium CCMM004]
MAIVAMVVFHFSFDLSFLGLTDWPVGSHPAWRAFAMATAGTFLFLVGVSLVYAHGRGVRWRPFLRRLAVIAAAAAAVTVGTAIAMPYPVWFGILHAIATFSVLAIPFLRAPIWLIVGAAAAVFVAPWVLTHPMFQPVWFYPLGLSPAPMPSFDYEPIFPWFAATLAGVAAARLAPPPKATPGPGGALAWLGRNSLWIYLVHQPVLLTLLIGWTWVARVV